jgi:hypothetical protein
MKHAGAADREPYVVLRDLDDLVASGPSSEHKRPSTGRGPAYPELPRCNNETPCRDREREHADCFFHAAQLRISMIIWDRI